MGLTLDTGNEEKNKKLAQSPVLRQRYVLSGGMIHKVSCPKASSDGSGGFVPSIERGQTLGFKRCDCLQEGQ